MRTGDFAWHCVSRKRGEIVPADERAGSLAHRLHVEPLLDPPGAAAIEGQRRAPVDDPIDIEAAAGAAAGVKIVGRAFGLQDRDGVLSEMGVEPLHEPERRPVALEIDVRHLSGGVNASVGPPGTMRDGRLARHAENRLFQRLLDRDAVLLSLPADERRAVIFECELEARHSGLRAMRRRGKGNRLLYHRVLARKWRISRRGRRRRSDAGERRRPNPVDDGLSLHRLTCLQRKRQRDARMSVGKPPQPVGRGR